MNLCCHLLNLTDFFLPWLLNTYTRMCIYKVIVFASLSSATWSNYQYFFPLILLCPTSNGIVILRNTQMLFSSKAFLWLNTIRLWLNLWAKVSMFSQCSNYFCVCICMFKFLNLFISFVALDKLVNFLNFNFCNFLVGWGLELRVSCLQSRCSNLSHTYTPISIFLNKDTFYL
jgi:hypothetical protein